MALIDVSEELQETIRELRNETYNDLPVDNEDEVYNLLAGIEFYCLNCDESSDMHEVSIGDDGIYCETCDTEVKINTDRSTITGQ